MSRRDRLSYHPLMARAAAMLEELVPENNFVLVFPIQAGDTERLLSI